MCVAFAFQTFLELTNEQQPTVPCQAGFVAPLPFTFEPEHQDHSLGSTGSSSDSSSWPTPPPTLNEENIAGSQSKWLVFLPGVNENVLFF